MFSHIMIGANDISASKQFYDATFGALGVGPGNPDPKGRVVYSTPTGVFMLTRPINGQPANGANGGTIGFAAKSTEAIDKWFTVGLANKGTACEDPPGERGSCYLAYLKDWAGNKVCALLPA